MSSDIRGSDNFDSATYNEWLFESGELTVATAGGVSAIHGLGFKPTTVQAVIICKIAEDGYEVGDEVHVATDINSSSRKTLWASATEIGLSYPTTYTAINHKTSGASVTLVSTNWRFILRAK